MSLLQGRLASLALFFAAATTGCGAESPPDAETDAAVLQSLGAAVSACTDERNACESAAIASVDCQTRFRACKTTAVDKATPKLTAGAQACAEDARTCRKDAKDDAAKEACKSEHSECVAEHTGASDPSRGGSAASPVAKCTDALHACMATDKEAKTCTDALRSCLDDALPNHAGGKDAHADAGANKPDHAGKKDGGTDANGQSATAQACSEARKACVAAGKPAQDCAQAVKSCH